MNLLETFLNLVEFVNFLLKIIDFFVNLAKDLHWQCVFVPHS